MSLRNNFPGLESWFEAMVHPSVVGNPVAVAKNRSFISSHILGGLIALCVIPVYLAVYGAPDLVEALAFAWFVSPVAIALFLSRTGRFEVAHAISTLNLVGLVSFAAIMTGGLGSFLIAWMLVVPFEAALSASKRVIGSAILFAMLALMGLWGVEFLGLLPSPRNLGFNNDLLILFGVGSAIAYAGGVALSVYNIHKETEQVVLASERRYRLMSENASDLVTRHRPNGHVLYASLGAERVVGTSADKLMADGLFDRILVSDRPAFLTAIAKAARGGEETTVEFRLNRQIGDRGLEPGEFFWAEMRCRKLDDAAHNDEIVAITRDISERKAQEQTLLLAREEAEKASQAKTHFLANMSHELRTPLNAIIGFSELLSSSNSGPAQIVRDQEYANLINESGLHLLDLVNGILDMSRIETGSFEIITEHFDVRPVVDICCQIVRPQLLNRNMEIVQDMGNDLSEIVADERAVKQILLNLLSNAIKFSEQGSRIYVGTSIVADSLVLSVRDTGIGISKENLPRLGSPFFQIDASYNRNHEGTGLGLSVVKGLVDLHKGGMEIESELNVGTTVTVRLPVGGIEEFSQSSDSGETRAVFLKSA